MCFHKLGPASLLERMPKIFALSQTLCNLTCKLCFVLLVVPFYFHLFEERISFQLMCACIFQVLSNDRNFLWAFFHRAANICNCLSVTLEIYFTAVMLFVSDDSIKSINRSHFRKLAVATHTLRVFLDVYAKVFEIFILVFLLLIHLQFFFLN